MIKKLLLILAIMIIVLSLNVTADDICGDGVKDIGEVCDNGIYNSDVAPDSCRSDCRFAYCNDGVVDSGEVCDESNYNPDPIPNKCRTTCTLPYCGDGVLDDDRLSVHPYTGFYEECDDGNNNDYDGCTNDCKECLAVYDDLIITESPGIPLCGEELEIKDEGQDGIIIIEGFDVTLDCAGTVLIGIGGLESVSANIGNNMLDIMGGGSDQPEEDPEEPIVEGSGSNNPPGNSFVPKAGTGIVINGDAVVLKNCNVGNFRTGLKVNGGGATVIDSIFCDNNMDIRSTLFTNYGTENYCDDVLNWYEPNPGCTYKCDGTLNDAELDKACFSIESKPEEEKTGFFAKVKQFLGFGDKKKDLLLEPETKKTEKPEFEGKSKITMPDEEELEEPSFSVKKPSFMEELKEEPKAEVKSIVPKTTVKKIPEPEEEPVVAKPKTLTIKPVAENTTTKIVKEPINISPVVKQTIPTIPIVKNAGLLKFR